MIHLKLLLLGISLVLSSYAHASDLTENPLGLKFDYSGFVFTSLYSNQDFRENKTVLTLNGNIRHSSGFGINTQVTTNKLDHNLKRLKVYWSNRILDKMTVRVDVGRLNFLKGLYSGIADSPSISMLGQLPLAPYDDLRISSTYGSVEGVKLALGNQLHNAYINLEFIKGKPKYVSQEKLQLYGFGDYYPYIEVNVDDMTASILTIEMKDYTVLAEYTNYVGSYTLDTSKMNTLLDHYIGSALTANDPEIDFYRLSFAMYGISPLQLELNTEIFKLDSVASGVWDGYYIMLKMDHKDYQYFVGQSTLDISRSGAEDISTNDLFIGVGRNLENFFAIAEYHYLRDDVGLWSQNFSPNSSTFILTLGYRF